MRLNRVSFFHHIVLLSLALSACASPSDPGPAQTAAAQTLDAALSLAQDDSALQTAEAQNAALEATNAALATANAQLEIEGQLTADAAATLAAVPTQLIAPSGAVCRVGPDGAFGQVAELIAGQPYEVFARSEDSEWWQIASPAGGSATCWVFGSDDFEFTGNVLNLPLLAGPSTPAAPLATAAPTHAPGISARFDNIVTCGGTRYVVVRVRNLGPDTYQSAIVTLGDVADNELARSDGNNEFLPNGDPCDPAGPTLLPGQERFVAVRITGASPGDTLYVKVIVCTEKGAKGECVGALISFVN